MSHFSVTVILPEAPTDDTLGQALAPFHEFECTGLDNEYVQDVDITQEARDEYESTTYDMLRQPDGTLISAYDDACYRDPTPDELAAIGPLFGTGCAKGLSYTSKDWGDGRGYRPKVRYVPEGCTEVEAKAPEIKSFAAFVDDYYGKPTLADGTAPGRAHKYGYALTDANGDVIKVVKRTNPNAEWDWWVLGGRWQGLLHVKNGAAHGVGRKGLMGSSSQRGGVDWARLGDLDIDLMKNVAVNERREHWATTIAKAREAGLFTTEQALDDTRRAFYRKKAAEWGAFQAADDRLTRRAHYEAFMGDLFAYDGIFNEWGPTTTDRDMPIGEWIDTAPPFSTFALLKDGRWCERGDMGWWGVVSGEKDMAAWEREFEALLRSSPPEHYVAIVDCHI